MVDQIRSSAVNGQIAAAPTRVRSQRPDDPIGRRQSLLSGAFLIRLPMNPTTHSNTALVRRGEKSIAGLERL